MLERLGIRESRSDRIEPLPKVRRKRDRFRAFTSQRETVSHNL
jgi:hypothetical protein